MIRKLAIGALACLNLLMGSAAHAQTMTAASASPAGASGRTQSCGEATGPTACGAGGPASKSDQSVDEGGGNPINVITGNKYQREVDLPALPGVLGLELVRHYNSQFSNIGFPNGIMGRGWKLSYETELHVVGRALQIVQADGARLIFSRDLLNPSQCGTSRASDGRIAIRRGPHGDEYVWSWPNGRRLSFDHRGKLVQIAAPTGEFATLQHDARGHLVQVTDPQGRQLKLNYAEPARGKDQPVRFTGVQSIDTPVGRFAYDYGSPPPKGTQVEPIQLVANLVKVHLPTRYEADKPAHPLTSRGTTTSAISRAYHYEDARFPTLLTGISVAGTGSDGKPMHQRVSTYGYDPRGWAVLSEHGGLKVELTELERASLSELPGSTPGRSVLVHGRTAARPEGRRLEIRSAMVAGDYRITETRGEPCVAALPCPRANMRYRYDAKGRLIEEIQLDPQGRPLLGVRTAYDPLDRVLRVSQVVYKDGKPAAERWMVRYEYGATGEQPTLIAKPSVVAGREHQMHMAYNDQGQVLSVAESGYSPLDAQGRPIMQPNQADQASPITRITRYDYSRINGRSVLVAVDGPLPGRADTVRYQWDGRADFVHAMRHPLGLSETYHRDDAGRVNVRTSADQVDIALAHLPTGEPSSWRRGPAMAKVQYDALQRPTRIELPDGEVRRFAHAGQQGTAMASNAGWAHWITLPETLDPQALESGLPASLRAPPSHPREQPPNEAPSQPWKGARAVVDDFGRLVATYTSVTGWEHRRYDEAGRLRERRLADGTVWRWQRDALGRIVQHESAAPGKPAVITRLQYKGTHLVALQHPLESEQLGHDALGRLAWRTVSRQGGGRHASLQATEHYEYDEADRLTTWHLPEGGSLRYEWGVGRQLRAVRHRNGQAEAVLGSAVANWLSERLGVGQRTVIEPLPASARSTGADAHARRAAADASPDASVLPAPLRSEQGYRWGNGVALRWHLNGQGRLAQMRWELPGQGKGWLGEWMTAWLPQARAVEAVQAGVDAQAGAASASAASSAMKPPANPTASLLMQADFDYDMLGRMQGRSGLDQGGTAQRIGFAYDGRGRLLMAQPMDEQLDATHAAAAQPAAQPAVHPEFYAYDVQGRLQVARWHGRDHDWRGMNVQRDATGLPVRIGGMAGQPERALAYSADRRLAEVRQANVLLARYAHNTHGLRIAKTVYADGQRDKGQHTQYLWQGMKLVAEMLPQAVPQDGNAQDEAPAKLSRRYVYAHNVPVAVIDYADGADLRREERGLGAWFMAVWRWIGPNNGELRYVHANEIGTPVAVTDARARVIWRARPTAYGVVGELKAAQTEYAPHGFTLNLRLPGQYFDAETGWHDNVLRTYDPQRGEYLEPDPLGPVPNWRSARLLTQPFAYANQNPLIYADPSGLILFAFDGTGNSVRPARGDSISNVEKFRQAYDESVNGPKYYITGIGTTDERMEYEGSMKTGDGFEERVALGLTLLDEHIDGEARKSGSSSSQTANAVLDIDVVGFSRGAAEARAWLNEVVKKLEQGPYTSANGNRRCLNFRFLGLWDTVPHLGADHGNEKNHNFRIPALVKYAVHAVAVNEHRGGVADFDALSIHDNSTVANSGTRVERGFVGAHADVGGGYGQGDLSDVALMWVLDRARSQGVAFDQEKIQDGGWNVVTSPLVHDPRVGDYGTNESAWADDGDRHFNYLFSKDHEQKRVTLAAGVTTTATAQAVIQNFTRRCGRDGSVVGMVDMKRYASWMGVVGLTYATQPQLPSNCR